MGEYTLKAVLTVNDGNDRTERYMYETDCVVELLKVNDRHAVFYDKELKMHFENKSAVTYLYGLEITDARLSFEGPSAKSEDFHRLLFFRYDGIRPHIDAGGKLIGIGNTGEAKQMWRKMRRKILSDYRGGYLETYLDLLEEEIENNRAFIGAMRRYLHFGLLFPHIPLEHPARWENKRIVEFSEYEREEFEEHTVYRETEENIRIYDLTGTSLPGSKSRLLEYQGEIRIAENELIPRESEICTVSSWGQIGNRMAFPIE